VRAVAPPLVAALVALAMGFFFARFSLALCLAVLVFMLLAGVGVPALIRRLSREPGLRLVEGRAALSAALVDGIQGMPDLLAFNQEARQSELIQKLSAGLAGAQKRMARLAGFQAGSELFLAQLCLWSVLLLAIPLVATGQVQGVYLAVLALAALTSFEAVAPLRRLLNTWRATCSLPGACSKSWTRNPLCMILNNPCRCRKKSA